MTLHAVAVRKIYANARPVGQFLKLGGILEIFICLDLLCEILYFLKAKCRIIGAENMIWERESQVMNLLWPSK